jgi:hypothetical protein
MRPKLHYRKAQARPLAPASQRVLSLFEGAKQAGDIGRIHSWTLVGDGDVDEFRMMFRFDPHHRSFRCEGDRILHQIGQDAAQAARVGDHGREGAAPLDDGSDAARADFVRKAVEDVVQRVIQGLDAQVEVHSATLQAGDLKDLVHQFEQPHPAGADDSGIFLVLGRSQGAVELRGDDLGEAQNGVEGCAQFVADHAQE